MQARERKLADNGPLTCNEYATCITVGLTASMNELAFSQVLSYVTYTQIGGHLSFAWGRVIRA